MPTVSEIYDFIDSFAPFSTQDSFDNSGLVVGHMDDSKQIEKILISLDATISVVEEAQRIGAQLILTHHPVIFHAIKHLDSSFPYALAVKYSIPVISAHTCLDSAKYGISDMMVDALGFENLGRVPYINRADPKSGAPIGYGATAKCRKMSGYELAALCKERFDNPAIRWSDGGSDIEIVACGSGACSDILEYAHCQGAQAVITADIKLDRFLEADRLGMTLIDAGHYETEAIALPYLKKKLELRFGVKCVISSADRVIKGV